MSICKNCYYRKKLIFNLFKQDKQRPRIYTVHCGLIPTKDPLFIKCEHFKSK